MNIIKPKQQLLGLIGIGRMGGRIARRLLDHGYNLIAYNRNRVAAEAQKYSWRKPQPFTIKSSTPRLVRPSD